MEDLIAQLNADKNYFEKELIEMQVKNSDMHDELKLKNKEIFDLREAAESVDISVSTHLERIGELEQGTLLALGRAKGIPWHSRLRAAAPRFRDRRPAAGAASP